MRHTDDRSPSVRRFDGAAAGNPIGARWAFGAAELNTVRLDGEGRSDLLVGTHVLLCTIEGGSLDVRVEAEGAGCWQGPKRAGAAGFFPAGRRVRSRWPAASLTYLALFVEPQAIDEMLDRPAPGLDWQTRVDAGDPFIATASQRLAGALRESVDPLSSLLAETLATALHLHVAGRFSNAGRDVAPVDTGIGRVLDLIHAELPNALSLSQMIAASGLPRARFLASFRARTGVSPHQYILRERLARARLLLEKTTRSIGDVAAEVGCANAGHLAQLFRRHLGLSPRAWRHGRDRL